MAKELARQGAEHRLLSVPGAGHGLAGGDPEQVNQAHERGLAFIRKYLKVRQD